MDRQGARRLLTLALLIGGMVLGELAIWADGHEPAQTGELLRASVACVTAATLIAARYDR